MHIHILGICGTFMAGIALIAKAQGHQVTGSDSNVYPPMSDVLKQADIAIISGYDVDQLDPVPDIVIIGNAMTRGNPCVEAILNQRIPYTSGPQWLHDNVLKDRWVLAVAGTHGKTTTSCMLAWILQDYGYQPGFIIGGMPGNFEVSARLGESHYFVIEADEYDSAFFDKRSKFVHYCPSTLIINNLEFDHADIFDNLAAIERQFHHLIRTVPGQGRIIYSDDDVNTQHTLALGCWSECEALGISSGWQVQPLCNDHSRFDVYFQGVKVGHVAWSLLGAHNMCNALAAIAAAHHVGIPAEQACQALHRFINAKRRLELKAEVNTIQIYDDFAHHPTAILATLSALRSKLGKDRRILAIVEPRSNSMKMGYGKEALAPALAAADEVYIYQPSTITWAVTDITEHCQQPAYWASDIDDLVKLVVNHAKRNDVILVMSNGSFGGIHDKIAASLATNACFC